MKREVTVSLSIAICSLAFLMMSHAKALNPNGSTDNDGAAESVAAQMVPANAVLLKSLDARKAQPGQEFRAKLSDKVKLKDGTELPRGTELVGTVAKDDMQTSGTSTLALRIAKADLKNGKVIPIKATIVSVYHADTPEAVEPNGWTPSELQIDQESALGSVALHSRIGDVNSGVFESTKKDDVKLPQGFGMSLAITARPGSGSNGGA